MYLEDLCLTLTFILSEVLMHALRHVHGVLFLVALILILWTKHLFRKWNADRILRTDFWVKLGYLVLTMFLALLALFFVWVPLYEVYGRIAAMLDPDLRHTAMRYRGIFFVFMGSALFASAITRTDFFLDPVDVSEPHYTAKLFRLVESVLHLCVWLYRHTLLPIAGMLAYVLRAEWFSWGLQTTAGGRGRRVVGCTLAPYSEESLLGSASRDGHVAVQDVRDQSSTTTTTTINSNSARQTDATDSTTTAKTTKKPRRQSADYTVVHSANLIPIRSAPTTRSQPRTFQAEMRGSGSKVRVLRERPYVHSMCGSPGTSDRARRP